MTALAWATPWEEAPEALKVLKMFRASISVVLMVVPPGWMIKGWPAVRARFWSKSLKPLVRDRNTQMVMEGITLGMVTLNRVVQREAPSMRAASSISPETFCKPAM